MAGWQAPVVKGGGRVPLLRPFLYPVRQLMHFRTSLPGWPPTELVFAYSISLASGAVVASYATTCAQTAVWVALRSLSVARRAELPGCVAIPEPEP
jgi:hypothetical protein